MDIKFTKMHSCGNDYIYFDCFETATVIHDPAGVSRVLSRRRFGIGGDGIVLMLPSDKADAEMRIFNRDGSEGKMCGNAIRCVAKYLYENKIVTKTDMGIETLSGIKKLSLITAQGFVSAVEVDMGQAILEPGKIPVQLAGEAVIAQPVEINGQVYEITCVSMGNPHAVVFCADVEAWRLAETGPLFEHSPLFPDRVNLEIAEMLSRSHIKMRVWERGSGETLACGTGACACAVAAILNGHCDRDTDITVAMPGGALTIRCTDETIYMTGGCEKIFDGVVAI